jgi:hypothetical protein
MDHLCYSGLSFEAQRAAFLDVVVAGPLLREVLGRVRALALPDWLVVSGALYTFAAPSSAHHPISRPCQDHAIRTILRPPLHPPAASLYR